MKKSKLSMAAVMAFYIAAGILACTVFFLQGSSLTGEEASAQTELYDIKPQLSQASQPADSDATASQPETSLAESESAPEMSEAAHSESADDIEEETRYYSLLH